MHIYIVFVLKTFDIVLPANFKILYSYITTKLVIMFEGDFPANNIFTTENIPKIKADSACATNLTYLYILVIIMTVGLSSSKVFSLF